MINLLISPIKGRFVSKLGGYSIFMKYSCQIQTAVIFIIREWVVCNSCMTDRSVLRTELLCPTSNSYIWLIGIPDMRKYLLFMNIDYDDHYYQQQRFYLTCFTLAFLSTYSELCPENGKTLIYFQTVKTIFQDCLHPTQRIHTCMYMSRSISISSYCQRYCAMSDITIHITFIYFYFYYIYFYLHISSTKIKNYYYCHHYLWYQ
jgi:hypothetical protein